MYGLLVSHAWRNHGNWIEKEVISSMGVDNVIGTVYKYSRMDIVSCCDGKSVADPFAMRPTVIEDRIIDILIMFFFLSQNNTMTERHCPNLALSISSNKKTPLSA
jgi:hypothetical protein